MSLILTRRAGFRASLMAGVGLFCAFGPAYAQSSAAPAVSTSTDATAAPSPVADQAAPASQTGAAPAQPDASAPSSPAAPPSAFSEITVTARRVAENVQRVPLAVTAVGDATLKKVDIHDASTIAKVSPGVEVCCNAFNNDGITFVRGISGGAPTYFGDVPVGANGFGNFFDISSVQVLKGPQGTLFGQASNAGAFIFQPRRPGETFGGTVSAIGGTYDRRGFQAAVDVPIADRIFFRIAGETNYRRGYVKDVSNNTWQGKDDYYNIRPSVVIKVTDNLENYTLFQYSHAKTDGGQIGLFVLGDYDFSPQVPQNAQLVALNGGTQAAYDALRAQYLLRQRALGPYAVQGSSLGCPSGNGPVFGASTVTSVDAPSTSCLRVWTSEKRMINTTTYNFADQWSLKNIASYISSKAYNTGTDLDTTPLIQADIGDPRNYRPTSGPKGWSDELQLHGKAGIFDFTAGTFYLNRKSDTHLQYSNFDVDAPSASRAIFGTETEAVYGQTNIHLDGLLKGLTATAGARYNQDKLTQTTYGYDPVTLALTGVVGGPNSPAGHTKYHNISYTFGLQWQLAARTMLYFTTARGFNAGGLQNVVGFESYKPDSLTNYEIGVKSTFTVAGMQARVNLDGYYGNFNNVQVYTFRNALNPATGTISPTTVIQNAAAALVRGFEGEFDLNPFSGFQIGGFFAYGNNKFTKYPSIDPTTGAPVDLKNSTFIFAPRWKYGLRASYQTRLPGNAGKLQFSGNFDDRTKMYSQSLPITPTDPSNPLTGIVCKRQHTVANGYPASVADGKWSYIDCNPGFANIDMSADWIDFMGRPGLTLTFAVTNVTGHVRSDVIGDQRQQGVSMPTPALPRMFTLRATYDF